VVSDELELKYAIDDIEAVARWLDDALPPAEGSGWQASEVTDTYFDTAEHALARAGYGARLRRIGGRTTLELKSNAEVDGALHRRVEVEAGASPALDAQAWPPSEGREIVEHLAGGQPLVARFVLRQHRRKRDHSGFELSLDEVVIARGRRRLGRLTELEVERKTGRPRALRRLGSQLEASGLVKAEPRSKMAAAAALVEGPPSVYPTDLLAEAGRKVLARHLERFFDREAEARSGDNLALKQMRVASRRMRATWRAFAPAYRRADERRYVSELRGVARRLGAVRDLDVLLEKLPSDEGLAPLVEAWQARRETAWNELLTTLDSGEYGDFIDDYRNFVAHSGAASTARGRSRRVSDSAASLVWSAYEQVRSAEPNMAGAGRPQPAPEELHALRIAARQFRYTIEAFRDVLDESAVTSLLERLVRLQDALGELNDADVGAREVRAWLAEQPAPPAAVGAYLAQLEQAVERGVEAVVPTVAGVIGPPFRRLLGRAVAAI
jgi:triphosphatase